MTGKYSRVILSCSLVAMLPVMAHAAGTYYNGRGYSSPQRNYATTPYAARQQNTSYTQDTTYTRTRTVTPNANAAVGQPYQNYTRVVGGQTQNVYATSASPQTTNTSGTGFVLNAGISHEFASWAFDMKEAGSKLHYDNLHWNVFDVSAAYKFNAGNTLMRIDAGLRYGLQFGDSPMIDDDTTNGGYIVTEWWNDTDSDGTPDSLIGSQVGHSLSVGTSNGGNMLGLNAGFALADLITAGAVRITPSVGFRYLKYKLETKNDFGLTIDTGYCSAGAGNETQCEPIVVAIYGDGAQSVLWEPNENGLWNIPSGATQIDTGGTYAFKLPDISHSYETTWMGPYLAMDLDYQINNYNLMNARFELGLPMYTSTGDQPYRSDWQHPKSVEDKGGFGDAWHIGLGMNYMTALSESVFLSLGFNFDYYTMSGGDASTYLNSDYYMGIYNALLAHYQANGKTEAQMLEVDATAQNIKQLQSECPGWVCKVDNEIETIYKSLGVRIGIQAKF